MDGQAWLRSGIRFEARRSVMSVPARTSPTRQEWSVFVLSARTISMDIRRAPTLSSPAGAPNVDGTDRAPRTSVPSSNVIANRTGIARSDSSPSNRPLQQTNATPVHSEAGLCRDAAGCARGSSRPWYARRRPWRSLLNGRSFGRRRHDCEFVAPRVVAMPDCQGIEAQRVQTPAS